MLHELQIIGDGRGCLADDGSVLLRYMGKVVIWRQALLKQTELSDAVLWAKLSAGGSRILYELGTRGDPHRLGILDIGTGRHRVIANGPMVPPLPPRPLFSPAVFPVYPYFSASMSIDDEVILYYSQDGAWLDRSGNVRQLTSRPITAGVLSGYGNMAYAVSENWLLEVDQETVAWRWLLFPEDPAP